MAAVLQAWKILVASLAGWLTRQQDAVIEGEAPAAAGSVPDGAIVPGAPLTIAKGPLGRIVLVWGSSRSGDPDDEIYEGELGGDFTSHTAKFCTTAGLTTKMFVPVAPSTYYLVLPTDGVVEGSYGSDSDGSQRARGVSTCVPQRFADCS